MAETIQDRMDAMSAQHPDVSGPMTSDQVLEWVAASPWLAGLAGYNKLNLDTVARANCAFRFQRGVEFEAMNKRPPTNADLGTSYYADANLFAERLGVLQPFDKPNNRLRGDYGGPF